MTLREVLENGAGELSLVLGEQELRQFELYYGLLQEWNQRFNLTAIEGVEETVIKHFLDSLLAIQVLGEVEHVVDVGSGAGFPGIPLKIVRPGWQMVLVEARQKKAVFLHEVVERLELRNVEVVTERAEEMGRSARWREVFSVACSRAVARLDVLAEYCLPLVQVGGKMVAAKGPTGREEVKACQAAFAILGGGQAMLWEGKLPLSKEQRSLIVVKKEQLCPEKYPRRPGIPEKRPLGER